MSSLHLSKNETNSAIAIRIFLQQTPNSAGKIYRLMPIVLCYKDVDRQLQSAGKSKITEHTTLICGMVFLWFSLRLKEKVCEGDVVQVGCQLSISDMITPLPSRETDGDSEDVAPYLKKKQPSSASWFGTLPQLERILYQNSNTVMCVSLSVTYELWMSVE